MGRLSACGLRLLCLSSLRRSKAKYFEAGGELHLDGCTFVNSTAERGGALNVSGGTVRAEGTAFVGCHAR